MSLRDATSSTILKDGSVGGDELANDSVGTDELIDSGVATIDLESGAVTTDKLGTSLVIDAAEVVNEDYHEKVVTGQVSGTTGLDLSSGNLFWHTLTGDTTFEFNNPEDTDAQGNSFFLIIDQDGTGGHAITWPSSVEWDGGSAPGFPTDANSRHAVSFVSPDGGTTWLGTIAGESFA